MNFYIGGTIPQAGIDPPTQSHASYEASALPTSHHSWISLNPFLSYKSRQDLNNRHPNKQFLWLRNFFLSRHFDDLNTNLDSTCYHLLINMCYNIVNPPSPSQMCDVIFEWPFVLNILDLCELSFILICSCIITHRRKPCLLILGALNELLFTIDFSINTFKVNLFYHKNIANSIGNSDTKKGILVSPRKVSCLRIVTVS